MANQLQRIGLTPGKAALMAVLAVVLVVVWGPTLGQLIGGQKTGKPSVESGSAGISRSAATNTTAGVASLPSPPAKPERVRPVFTVEEASVYDPFAPPAWSPSKRRQQRTGTLAAEPSELESRFGNLRQTGVAMILVSGGGQAAQVGDRTLRVGDIIDGFEVVRIDANGVTFEPAPPEPEGDSRGA